MIKNFLTRHKLLLGIILIAILLRFIGINPGYPPIHTDEGITHHQGLLIILNHSLDPTQNSSSNKFDYLVYPIVVPLINAIFYLFIFIPISSLGYLMIHIGDLPILFKSGSEQTWAIISNNIFGSSQINTIFWGRYVTALFGLGVVVMSYLLGKLLFRSSTVGLITAFLIAINYRQVLNSHFGLPDVYNALFLLLALWQMVRLFNKPTRKNYILTGIAVALSFSTKFSFYIFFPLLFIIVNQWLKVKKSVNIFRFFLKINNLILFGIMLGIIGILGIYHIIYFPETIKQINYLSLRYKTGIMTFDFYAVAYLYYITLGPWTSMLTIIGICMGLIRKFFATLFLLTVLIPFFGFMIYYSQGGSSTRNFITVTPLLLIFCALSIYLLWYFLSKYSRFLAFSFCLIIIAFISFEALKNSIIVPIEYSKPWNYKVAQKWVGQNIPAGSSIVAHSTTPFFGKKVKIILANKPDDYFLQEMQEKNATWSVINLEHINSEFLWWMNQDLTTQFKLDWFPTKFLLNTPLAKMTLELRDYIVFEALNPWQAPDNNFLVVKIPPKIYFEKGKLIYKENFRKDRVWTIVNDNFGAVNNLFWDDKIGFNQNGSLKISESSSGIYSQRFISPKVAVQGGKVYKIRGMMHSSIILGPDNKDGFLEADFLSENGRIIKMALSSRLEDLDGWVNKEIVVQSPPDARYLQLAFFKGKSDFVSIWLDDIEVWESTENIVINTDEMYIKSNFKLEEHLFLTSNGGM